MARVVRPDQCAMGVGRASSVVCHCSRLLARPQQVPRVNRDFKASPHIRVLFRIQPVLKALGGI